MAYARRFWETSGSFTDLGCIVLPGFRVVTTNDSVLSVTPEFLVRVAIEAIARVESDGRKYETEGEISFFYRRPDQEWWVKIFYYDDLPVLYLTRLWKDKT